MGKTFSELNLRTLRESIRRTLRMAVVEGAVMRKINDREKALAIEGERGVAVVVVSRADIRDGRPDMRGLVETAHAHAKSRRWHRAMRRGSCRPL